MPRSSDLLASYRAKRALERTPEPAGAVGRSEGRLFVVHKHAARHLHFDLRLEMEGVLRSWAVPKGPSANPADKRLAVLVEDHPVEYGDFEGKIPEGNYGAGAVIVWDRGEWVPIEDPLEGLEKGKLLFELRGYKLKGLWTLVKIKKSQKEWLFIKERDGWVREDGGDYPEASVLSGLTVEQLKAGYDAADPIREELRRLKAPRRTVSAADVELMLAETREKPFSREGWLFELKLDGYRMIVARERGEARLLTRNGHDAVATFPEVARAVAALPFDGVVLDGEVVAVDQAGHPSFQRLQQRGRLTGALEVRRAAVENPVTFFAFDLLGFEGFDLRRLPLVQRKALLRRVLPPAGALRYLDHFEERGEALYAEVERMGLEGIVAKKMDAPYRGGRSASWLKIRSDRTEDFVIVGYTRAKGSRGGFGAIHLAQFVGPDLAYVGRAGSGFTGRQLDQIRADLDRLRRETPASIGPVSPVSGQRIAMKDVPDFRTSVWVDPVLVAEVRYKEMTDEGYLRQPVFLRLRDDKPAAECRREQLAAGPADGLPDPAPTVAQDVPREVKFSNLDKIFWPDEGYTKGDLIAYYREISPWLLPYLRNRPVVLTRYPDGITGKSFFQKDAPAFAPDWLRTERRWSEDASREIDYFICDDVESLLYIANLGAIPLHIWASRSPSLEQPDWCILDLDPKEAPFEDVIQVARATHALCREIDLPAFIKTSGSSGLHVLVPLGRQCTHEQARTFGEVLAHAVVAREPGIATTTRQVHKRGGKVYVDYLQNGLGKLLAAPFSLRPLPGAPVSMPLRWSEVTRGLDIRKFTIRTAVQRMKRLKRDPVVEVLDLAPDLARVLERLHGAL
ncbi:MAG: DNA ligase D [Gemmatimonadales bacterium]